MRRSTLGQIGALLVALGLLAMVLGATVGGAGTPFGSWTAQGAWVGPGMMGAWGGDLPAPTQPSGSAVPEAGASGNVIHMQGSRFAPATLTVATGASVTWVNDDTLPHTVTARDGSWSSGNLAPGSTYTRTFATGGTYGYVCLYHPWMQGTITVG